MKTVQHIAQGPWWAISASLRASKYGDDITEIKFQHAITNNTTYTYVDDRNNNSKHWEEVIDLCNDNYRVKVGDLIYKTQNGRPMLHSRTRLPLVDADTRVKILDYEKDTELQAQADSRQQFYQQKIQELNDIFTKDVNGKYDIGHLINDPSTHPQPSDCIDDIRTKLKLRSLLSFADQLNRGVVK